MNRQNLTATPAANFVPIAFAAIVGANILSMSLMNFLEAPTQWCPLIYLASAASVAWLTVRCAPVFPRLTSKEHLFCIALATFLTLPRITYFLEGWLGYSVWILGDDIYHLQEMAALVHSPSFPPKSPFDETLYLRYYYAPFMPGPVLYWTSLVSTVKQALGLTLYIYAIFFSYALVYAAHILFKQTREQRVFVIVCVLYGGFDFLFWLSQHSFMPSHSEWWAIYFGFRVQYSNFITLSLWVQQHLIAAVAIVYALHIIHIARGGSSHLLAGILFSSAIFSSIFVTLGAMPLLAWFFIRHSHLRSVPIIAVTVITLAVPLIWIFLGNAGPVGFQLFGALQDQWLNQKLLAFGMFLVVLLLEFLPIVAAAPFAARRTPSAPWLLAISALFLFSTFFVSFTGANNYAMRGSILPIFTLLYLCTPIFSTWSLYIKTWTIAAAMTAYFSGSLLEYSSFMRGSIESFRRSNSDFNVQALRFNEGKPGVNIVNLVSRAGPNQILWYLLERPKPPKATLRPDDIETMIANNRYRITLSRILGR